MQTDLAQLLFARPGPTLGRRGRIPPRHVLPLLVLTACTGRKTVPEESAELPVEIRQRAVVPGHAASPTPWPDDAIDGVHGWLAIGSGSPGDPPPWGAIRASQPTIILTQRWEVPAGTTLYGLVPSGRVPLVVRDPETAIFGCDGGSELPHVTPLQGESRAGLVWVVSPTFGDAEGLPLEVIDTGGTRTWRFGEQQAGLSSIGTYEAALWQGSPERVVRTYDVSENPMQGHEPQPADVQGDFLVPQADAAWRVGSRTVLGLYRRSFEGIHFEALVIEDGDAGLHDLGYLYHCAF